MTTLIIILSAALTYALIDNRRLINQNRRLIDRNSRLLVHIAQQEENKEISAAPGYSPPKAPELFEIKKTDLN